MLLSAGLCEKKIAVCLRQRDLQVFVIPGLQRAESKSNENSFTRCHARGFSLCHPSLLRWSPTFGVFLVSLFTEWIFNLNHS